MAFDLQLAFVDVERNNETEKATPILTLKPGINGRHRYDDRITF